MLKVERREYLQAMRIAWDVAVLAALGTWHVAPSMAQQSEIPNPLSARTVSPRFEHLGLENLEADRGIVSLTKPNTGLTVAQLQEAKSITFKLRGDLWEEEAGPRPFSNDDAVPPRNDVAGLESRV